MNACCCSDPVCRHYGCQANRPPVAPTWMHAGSPPLHPQYYPDQTRPVVALTAEDVRRIMREEIEQLREGPK